MLSGKEKAVIFSPLLIFLLYVLYLAALTERPFLLLWIEGSFGLFVALVACNLLRRSIVDGSDNDHKSEDQEGDADRESEKSAKS